MNDAPRGLSTAFYAAVSIQLTIAHLHLNGLSCCSSEAAEDEQQQHSMHIASTAATLSIIVCGVCCIYLLIISFSRPSVLYQINSNARFLVATLKFLCSQTNMEFMLLKRRFWNVDAYVGETFVSIFSSLWWSMDLAKSDEKQLTKYLAHVRFDILINGFSTAKRSMILFVALQFYASQTKILERRRIFGPDIL